MASRSVLTIGGLTRRPSLQYPRCRNRSGSRVAFVEGLAGEAGIQGDIGDPPEARVIQGVDVAQAQLKRSEEPLAVVEPVVRPGGRRMIGDQGRMAMPIGSEEDERLRERAGSPRPR